MLIRMLGPLEVTDERGPVSLGAPKQRTLFSLLAMRFNRLVAVEDIVLELWGDYPPMSARANIRLYVSNLRQLLRGKAVQILKRGGGYMLTPVGDEVDLDFVRFTELIQQARARMNPSQASQAVKMFDEAIALWRGKPLADVLAGPELAAWCTGLEEEWLRALESRAECSMHNADPQRATTDLHEVLRVSPLRERAHALLVRARYQAGDVAGALAAFHAARGLLAEQLGVEPGAELRRLQKAVLARDTSITGPHLGDVPMPTIPVATIPESIDSADRALWLDGMLRRMSAEKWPMMIVMLADTK